MFLVVVLNCIKDLEICFGVWLLNCMICKLVLIEVGWVFYDSVCWVIEMLDEVEVVVLGFLGMLYGVLWVMVFLGLGWWLIVFLVLWFCVEYFGVEICLCLLDCNVDIIVDGIDLLFFFGELQDSVLKWCCIVECKWIFVVILEYLVQYGMLQILDELLVYNCLLLCYLCSLEFYWVLQILEGLQKMLVNGYFDVDDGDVLIDWVLDGCGIVNCLKYEVVEYLILGWLVQILFDMLFMFV